MRFVLRWRFPGYRIDFDAPFTVYAARDYGTALRLAPFWKPRDNPYNINSDGDFIDVTHLSFFGNWERNVALVQLDTWGKSSRDMLYAGYVHEILIQNVPALPHWLDFGLSKLIASTRISGNDIVFGSPTADWADLKSRQLLPVAQILHTSPARDWSNAGYLAWRSWSEESWALVHFLTFSPGMESGARILSFLHSLQAGQKADASFQAIFGDPSKLDASFAAYIHAKALPAAVAPDFPALDPAGVTERPLTKAQALAEQAIFHIERSDLEHGRAALLQALQLDPSLAIAHEELGFLDYGAGNLDQARAQWHTAVTLDPGRYVSAFATVMTGVPYGQQTPEQLASTLTELRRIAHLNPLFAPAYTQVAIVLWWQGKPDTAIRAAMEAQRLAPNRPGYQLLVARLLLATGKPTEAAALTRHLIETHSFADGGAEDFWQAIPADKRENGTPLVSKRPPGTFSAAGTLARVDCGDRNSRTPLHLVLHASTPQPGQTLDLTAGDHTHLGFDDTAWIGGGHSFVCHAAMARPAQVLYLPGAKGYGELLALDLDQDLPPATEGSDTSTSSNTVSKP